VSPEIVTILALVVIFAIATFLPINMGALAFVAAFLVGTLSVGLSTDEILAGFPAELVLTLIGVTYLFAIAQNNGTVDLLVRGAVKLVGGHVAAIPWIMFFVTAVLTAIGALSPAAVAIIAPIALTFAARHGISPLLMGMMVIHGAQGGGFSPISVYGVTVNDIVEEAGLPNSSIQVFLGSLFFNLAIALVLFVVLGGRKLLAGRWRPNPSSTSSTPTAPWSGATAPPRARRSAATTTSTSTPTSPSRCASSRSSRSSAWRSSPSWRWSSSSTSGSSRSPSPSSWHCSPRSSTRARSPRSAGAPSC